MTANGAPDEPRVIGTERVAQTVRATCMAGECDFNLLGFHGDISTTVAELNDVVRLHVLQTGHRVYVDDRRGLIVQRIKEK